MQPALLLGNPLWNPASSWGSVIEAPPYVRWIACRTLVNLPVPSSMAEFFGQFFVQQVEFVERLDVFRDEADRNGQDLFDARGFHLAQLRVVRGGEEGEQWLE